MVRVATTGLLLCAALVVGCAPRNAVVVVPTLEVAVNPASGRPLDASEPDPSEDGRAQGDLVEVEWRGSWWTATLVERRGARWLIHYDGYEKEWDEVVPIERIRDRRPRTEQIDLEPMDEGVDP